MARLAQVRHWLTCAHCGMQELHGEYGPDTLSPAIEELRVGKYRLYPNREAALAAGWLESESGLMLCWKHSKTVLCATPEEATALKMRHRAHAVALRTGLSFILLGEKLISENEERRATAAEVAMWQVLMSYALTHGHVI